MTKKPPKSEIEEYTLEDFDDKIHVGSGEFAYVYAVNSRRLGKVAIKCYKTPEKKQDMQEVQILLKNSSHPNIIRLFGIIVEKDDRIHCWGYVTELMHSSLSKCIHDLNFSYNYLRAYTWIEQIACGLQYLHSKEIIHRDIKPLNILLDVSYENVRLCDFGIARQYSFGTMTGCMGTLAYMAPENLNSRRYDYSTDIYSLTITSWEIFNRRKPYYHLQYEVLKLLEAITNGARPVVDAKLDIDLQNFIKRGWKSESSKRPSINDFMEFVKRKLGESSATENISFHATNDKPESVTVANVIAVPTSSNGKNKHPPTQKTSPNPQIPDQQVNQDFIIHNIELIDKVISRFLRRMSPTQIRDFQQKLDNLSLEENTLIIAPINFSEQNKEALRKWAEKNVSGHHREISVAKGDLLLLKNFKTSNFMNTLKKLFSMPTLQTPIPSYPSGKQLNPPKEVGILIAGDHRISLKTFISHAIAIYSRKILGRLRESVEKTQFPLDGYMNSFFLAKGGKGSLSERFNETRSELKQIKTGCLFFYVDTGTNQDVLTILESEPIGSLILVAVCEESCSVQIQKKVVELYGAKVLKCPILLLNKCDLVDRKEAEHLEAVTKVIEACISKAAALGSK